jgi:predicted HD phosphohydrolase
MANPDIADQSRHMLAAEHVSRQTHVLTHMQLAFGVGNDTSSILSTMLQDGQRIVKAQINTRSSGNSNDTAHLLHPPQ